MLDSTELKSIPEEGTVSTMEGSTLGVEPPEGIRSIRTTRLRVSKVLKRLRKRTPTNVEKSPPLDRVNGALLENRSEVSGITDFGDDLSYYGGDGPSNLRQSQRIPPSLEPSFPGKDSNSNGPSLSESLESFVDALSSLAKSKEMETLLHSSNQLAFSAAHKSLETAKTVGGFAVHTALLPVTLPLHITASATGLVVDTGSKTLHYFCDNLVPIVIKHSINQANGKRLKDGPQSVEKTATAKPIKENTSLRKKIETGEFKYDHDDFLDRLLLDSDSISGADDGSPAVFSVETDSLTMKLKEIEAKSAAESKFLLRVEDITIHVQPNPDSENIRVLCIDLKKGSSDEKLTLDALAQFSQRSIDIALSNEFVRSMLPEQEQSTAANTIPVTWKPLGQTKNDYDRLRSLSRDEYYNELRKRRCIWVGKFEGEEYNGCDNPFFMAQGVIDGSVTSIFDLLWDSSKAKEYNKQCVNRKDILTILEDDNDGLTLAKVIESDTKIPSTNICVKLRALMCSKPLGDRPEDGIVIFSRSLNEGPIGYHSNETVGLCRSGKNEVVLGINILRPMPGRPDLCDFISISQVDAGILPPFLRTRVGTFAVENFFKNIRACFPTANDN